ncbi:MAG: aquaporin [Streptococcus thermophilus]
MNDFLKEAFTSEWLLKYLTELFATAFLVALGNGSLLPTLSLQEQKVTNLVGLLLFWLWFWVMMPALMFGDVSGNHINPAFTLGLAASGLFSWVAVPGYLIANFSVLS